jgi:hypothetical protein
VTALEELDDKATVSGDTAEAFADSIKLLKKTGNDAAAADLSFRHYRSLLDGGSNDRTLFLALAQAHYNKKETENARRRLRQMLYCSVTPEWPEKEFLTEPTSAFIPEPLRDRAGRLAEQAGDWMAAKQFRTAASDTPITGAGSHTENLLAVARLEALHGDTTAAMRQLGELMADSKGAVQIRYEAANFVGTLMQQQLSPAVRTWLASPAGISSMGIPEIAQYLTALLLGNSGDLSGEVSAQATAIKQFPYSTLALERLLSLRDRQEAVAQIPAAISRWLFLKPENNLRRSEFFLWFYRHGQPRLAMSVLTQNGIDAYGNYWQGRQLASSPLEESEISRAGPHINLQPNRQAAFELADGISHAAETIDQLDKAEFFARWAQYLATDETSRRVAVERLRQLQSRRKEAVMQSARSYHVDPVISWGKEANP